MAKLKSSWFCQSCGANSAKWVGKCPSCNEWNTYVEEILKRAEPGGFKSPSSTRTSVPVKVGEIRESPEERMVLPGNELNRVLGGGLVPGSVVLFGGDPGIGKSTLMLQLALSMTGRKVLYISGEESEQQIGMRARRIGINNPECIILAETSTQIIFKHIEAIEPEMVIVDSIQTMHTELVDSAAGSISQIRESATEFMKFAKAAGIPVFLIGHITKEGSLAGPKVLEHMVDTVLQFEGDRNHLYRLLRSSKNRFGSTSELGIYEMQGGGLKEVDNPSEILVTERDEPVSGVAISATMEGMRPFMVEVQALASSAVYGTPQRSATGFDLRRLHMLLAVLEKRCGFRLGAKDVFLNLAGGFRADDPAVDLAVVAAILSSSEDLPIPTDIAFAAEIGLSGEVRPVSRVDQRIAEASKLGFKRIFISNYNRKGIAKQSNIEVIAVKRIEEVFNHLFG